MTRVEAIREMNHILAMTRERALGALRHASQPAGIANGEAQFVLSFDTSGAAVEIERGRRALNRLRDALTRPRVVRGDRVGRRRRRS